MDDRLGWIKSVFENEPKVQVTVFETLTVEYCSSVGASYILRGLRTAADFEYERAIAQMNRSMHPEIESVFLLTKPEHAHVASTIVRDVILHGGDASQFLPERVKITKKYRYNS